MSSHNTNRIKLVYAIRALEKKKYLEAISILLPLIEKSRGTSRLYSEYLLIIAYLGRDKFSDAALLIQKIERGGEEFGPVREIHAYMALKGASHLEEALQAIVRLENDFSSRKLKKMHQALAALSEKHFEEFQKKLKLKQVISIASPPKSMGSLPKLKFRISRNFILVIVFIGIVAGVFGVIRRAGFLNFLDRGKHVTAFASIDHSQFELSTSRYPLIDKNNQAKENSYNYQNEEELLGDYNKSRELIKKRKYNEALFLINRLLASNANIAVTNRVEFLKNFIASVSDRTYEKISIDRLVKNQNFISGYAVCFQGTVANLEKRKTKSAFTLLVNEKNNDFDGIIEVIMDEDHRVIKNGDTIAVEGIVLKADKNKSNIFIMKADNIE